MDAPWIETTLRWTLGLLALLCLFHAAFALNAFKDWVKRGAKNGDPQGLATLGQLEDIFERHSKTIESSRKESIRSVNDHITERSNNLLLELRSVRGALNELEKYVKELGHTMARLKQLEEQRLDMLSSLRDTVIRERK